jgi:DNA protecting protein DprA
MAKTNVKREPATTGEAAEGGGVPVRAVRTKTAGKPVRPRDRKPPAREQGPIPSVDRSIEDAVGVTVDELTALYVLDALKGFGPQKFKELHVQGLSAAAIVSDPSAMPIAGKRGDDLRRQLQAERTHSEPVCRRRAATQILAAYKHGAKIVTYRDPHYPPNVFDSNYPAPILFVRGSLDVLTMPHAVACVGSRKTRLPYAELEVEFVKASCRAGFVIVAGFALGADTVGHEQAWKAGGKTICVMPGGLDRPFPPENRPLWDEFLRYSGAVFVSEMGFGVRASALTLRKRNKLIVAFARGVLVAQSAKDGGAMNAFRFAVEQKKPVATFAPDETPDTSGNRLISAETWTRTLPSDGANPEVYEAWLRELSSSTSTARSGTASPGTQTSLLD